LRQDIGLGGTGSKVAQSGKTPAQTKWFVEPMNFGPLPSEKQPADSAAGDIPDHQNWQIFGFGFCGTPGDHRDTFCLTGIQL
jgi:hypothetical protein